MKRLAPAAAPIVALLLLNALLSFDLWSPTPIARPQLLLAPEFVLLWLALLAVVAWRGVPSPRLLSAVATVYLLLVLARYADVAARQWFGRSLNAYWDLPQVPRFLAVAAGDWPAWQLAGLVAAVALMLWALARLVRWAVVQAAREAAPFALRRRWALAVSAAVCLLVLPQLTGPTAWLADPGRWLAAPVTPMLWRQAGVLATAWSPSALARALPAATPVEEALAAPHGRPLAALAGRDVAIVMLESYGATVYDEPRAAAALAPRRAELAAAVAASGRQVVSAFVRSPTYGGASDLAHLGLLSGVDLGDPLRHDLLLTTGRPTLLALFRRHGYRTFGLYPAVSWEWPERAFYGYDVYLDGPSLGYRGPPFTFWRIPDQFALERFEQLHPRTADAPPRLLFFATINTHMPYGPQPPVQADLARLLGPQPFDEPEVRQALAREPDWLNQFPDYVRSFDTTYRWLAEHLRRPEPREGLVVIVGDHQPMANVSASASWDVPVHVIARDPGLLAPFVARGFAPGMEPPRQSLGAMHELTAILLQAFAGSPAAACAQRRAGPLPAGDTRAGSGSAAGVGC
ncbi:MAG: hypothetical protein MUF32_02630 [Burkholderiaceae bacterium]|jgi:hypothetical protein|nr:hypothetical protein [Burkholderiaceae bacterium]